MNFKKIIILTGFLIFYLSFFAQVTITGTIKDAQTGNILPGANIKIKNTKIVTISDSEGNYYLKNIGAKEIFVECSYIGYKTQSFKITQKKQHNVLNFNLDISVIANDEIVIIASKTEQNIRNLPARVHLISKKDIEATSVFSADDLFKNIPGISINRSLGIFSHKAILSMRGVNGNEQSRVLIMLDGVPMNKADGGSVNWNSINTDNINRIEILKGPGSSLYGSNAMGGVINIITNKPNKKISGKYTGEYGTYNTFSNRLKLAGSLIKNNKGFFWNVNGFHRKSDGYITIKEEERDSTTIKSNLLEYAAGAKIGYQFNNSNSIEYKFDYFHDFRGRGTKIRSENGIYFGRNSYFNKIRYKGTYNKFNYSILGFYNNEIYTRLNESIKLKNDKIKYKSYSVNSNRKDAGLMFNLSKQIFNNNVITAGFDAKLGSVYGQDIYSTSTDIVVNQGLMNIYALFIQDEMKLFNERLRLTAGLRFDYSDLKSGKFYIIDKTNATDILSELENKELLKNSWQALSPRFAAQYKFSEKFNIFTSYTKGFRAPILDDLCRSGFISGGFKKANTELEPETLNSFELGLNGNFNKIHVGMSGFYSIGNDFMYYVSTGDSIKFGSRNRPIRKKENISKVIIKGFEMDFSYSILPNLKFNTNYTFSDSKINEYNPKFGNSKLTGKYLTYVPKHQVAAGVAWRNKIVNLSFYYRYKDAQFRDDLNEEIFDAHSLYDIKIWRDITKYGSIGLNIQNISNVILIDDKDELSPGRFITVSLSLKI